MSSLLQLAANSGRSFAASPSGRWVRFENAATSVYVVEGAWGNAYMVWAGEPQSPAADAVQRYLRVEEAVQAALKIGN